MKNLEWSWVINVRITIFEWTISLNKFKGKETWLNYCIAFQFKQKSSSVSYVSYVSSWRSVKRLLRCSFLFFLFTFMSSLCLHSLFKSPSAASNPSVCLSSRLWPSFISPFNLNSASSSCIHYDPLRGWSHLQPFIYNNLTPSLLPCLEPRPHTTKHRDAQMRCKHLSPACSVSVIVKPAFWYSGNT